MTSLCLRHFLLAMNKPALLRCVTYIPHSSLGSLCLLSEGHYFWLFDCLICSLLRGSYCRSPYTTTWMVTPSGFLYPDRSRTGLPTFLLPHYIPGLYCMYACGIKLLNSMQTRDFIYTPSFNHTQGGILFGPQAAWAAPRNQKPFQVMGATP